MSRAAEEKMRRAGEPELAVAAFRDRYAQLLAGGAGIVAEAEIEPLERLPGLAELPWSASRAEAALGATVVIKINGGLGTSMGLSRAKGLLAVKDGLSFLEIAARQVLALRARHGVRLPLVLMNSAGTQADSLAALAGYDELGVDLAPDFLQGREPKLGADDLEPVSWPADPQLEWCPAGHGDLLVSLHSSGMLRRMLAAGYEYAFISNSDNLGAVADPRVLGWMAAEQLDFVAEQCDRTAADRKGGHLARRRADGRLLLRETAQTSPADRAAMQDVERHRYFNANNIWLRLSALADLFEGGRGVSLPVICNAKTVDPADPASPPVIQLETAIGSAISLFERASAIRVERDRFVPVKTTDDLLVLRSDCFELAPDSRVVVSPRRRGRPSQVPYVELDPAGFRMLDDFEARVAQAPSLLECDRLVVRGDVGFGRGVSVRGSVELDNRGRPPLRIPDGALLEG